MNGLFKGLVVASFGRHYEVAMADDAEPIQCVRRGKRLDVACGDRVEVNLTGSGQGVIEKVLERHSLFYRAAPHREKLLAANVDQALIVVAAEPSHSVELLSRCLIAAEAAGVSATILLNKQDLEQATARVSHALQYYADLGYRLVRISALQDVSVLRPVLQDRTSLLVGQSGMGKSTLINALFPEAQARTGEISQALDSGRHTTTATRYYRLDSRTALIDSPGLQEFGLAYLEPPDIATYFREFSGLLGQCRFANCQHLHEPDCALKNWARGHPQRELRLRYLTSLQLENTRGKAH